MNCIRFSEFSPSGLVTRVRAILESEGIAFTFEPADADDLTDAQFVLTNWPDGACVQVGTGYVSYNTVHGSEYYHKHVEDERALRQILAQNKKPFPWRVSRNDDYVDLECDLPDVQLPHGIMGGRLRITVEIDEEGTPVNDPVVSVTLDNEYGDQKIELAVDVDNVVNPTGFAWLSDMLASLAERLPLTLSAPVPTTTTTE